MSEDVKIEDEVTSSEESTEENLEEEAKETDESKDVPYNRFSKVVKERNELRDKLKASSDTNDAVKEALTPTPEPQQAKNEDESLSRGETILFAQGFTEEEVAYANKIAKLDGVGVAAAAKDPVFIGWKEKRDEQASNSAAQLGASKGSAPHSDVDFHAGMSNDDHRNLFKKKFNQ